MSDFQLNSSNSKEMPLGYMLICQEPCISQLPASLALAIAHRACGRRQLMIRASKSGQHSSFNNCSSYKTTKERSYTEGPSDKQNPHKLDFLNEEDIPLATEVEYRTPLWQASAYSPFLRCYRLLNRYSGKSDKLPQGSEKNDCPGHQNVNRLSHQ